MKTLFAGGIALAAAGAIYAGAVLLARRPSSPDARPAESLAVETDEKTGEKPGADRLLEREISRAQAASTSSEGTPAPERSSSPRSSEVAPAVGSMDGATATPPPEASGSAERRKQAAARVTGEPGPAIAVVPESVARQALSHVGFDPLAEEIWMLAINDPNLSAHTRQDLIEDLNEDGLPDPRNPTLEDLPLILRRIEIIEELAPTAMDKVNTEAFKEAHKDLVNMVTRLTRK